MNDRERAICARVRTIRQDVRYSQSLFARQLGITRPAVAAIEYGHTPLRYSLAEIICSAWRISPLWLASNKGAMHAWFSLPPATSIGAPENALLSEVFDTHLHALFETVRDKKGGNSSGQIITLSDRIKRLELIRERVADWIIEIPDKALEEFERAVIKAIDKTGKQCGKDDWRSIALRQNAISDAAATQNLLPESKQKDALTPDTEFRISAGVKREFTLPKLLEDLRRLTSAPGMKAKLAAHLKVPEPRVYEWLKGKYTPSGEITLELLNWVRAQESK